MTPEFCGWIILGFRRSDGAGHDGDDPVGNSHVTQDNLTKPRGSIVLLSDDGAQLLLPRARGQTAENRHIAQDRTRLSDEGDAGAVVVHSRVRYLNRRDIAHACSSS